MPLPTVIADLNTTASLNYPAGTDSPAVLDDVQRAHASFIAQLRDANTGTNTGDNATNTQYSGLAASKANAGPLASSGITGAAASGANTDITSLGAVTSINGGQLAGLRNRIINGNFAINQRAVTGTVVLAAGIYGHDRFKAGASGCTYTFATSANVTTLTISAGSLQQVIEGVNLETGTYALSWSGTATGKIGAGAYSASG